MPPCWIGRRKQKVVISSFCSSSSNVWFHSRYPLSRDWLETSNPRYSWSIEWLLLNPTEIDIFAPVLQPRSQGRTRCNSLWFLVVKSTKRIKLISHVTVPNWGPIWLTGDSSERLEVVLKKTSNKPDVYEGSQQTQVRHFFICLAITLWFLFFVCSRGEEFEITPMSSELLFYPASRVVVITGK